MKKNWMLCIDLMTQLQHDCYPRQGKGYKGRLMVVDDGEVCFVEKCCETDGKRNMRVFEGRYITMTLRLEDGRLRLNFKRICLRRGFDLNGYAIGVMNEICQALEGFVEK